MSDAEIICEAAGLCRPDHLNRPQALNALTLDMVRDATGPRRPGKAIRRSPGSW